MRLIRHCRGRVIHLGRPGSFVLRFKSGLTGKEQWLCRRHADCTARCLHDSTRVLSLPSSRPSHGVSYQVLQLVPSYLGTCVGLARCGSSLIVSASDVNYLMVIGHRETGTEKRYPPGRGLEELQSSDQCTEWPMILIVVITYPRSERYLWYR